MNKESSKKCLQIKSFKPVTPITRAKQDQLYSYKNTLRKSTTLKNKEMTNSTRSTTAKINQEIISDKELKNKQEALNYLKEKKTADKLKKIINHKDQIIANKSAKIKQLENETNSLKAQIEKNRMQIHKLTATLETNKKYQFEMAHKLIYDYICENEGESEQDDYPNPDIMTYEELLELENKIGYVSKGLKQEDIDNIPTMIFAIKERNNEEEDNKCLICQYDFEEGTKLRIIKCKHLFHKDCIDKWLTHEKVCPNCKREV